MKHASACSAVILSCAGCSSAPIHYYTLSAPEHEPIERRTMPPSIDMITTRMPRQVDRRQLVVRAGNNEMRILENEEWASAIGNEVSSAVRFELASQLAQVDPLTVRNIKAVSLNLDVTRFEAVMNRYDTLSATWRMKLTVNEETTHQSCPFGLLLPIEQGIPGVVAGYQHAIRSLAQSVVASMVTAGGGGAPLCPASD